MKSNNDNISRRKSLYGIVTSDKMEKSVVVQINLIVKHFLYGKYIRKRIKYMVHDNLNLCKAGDYVQIEECRPISKNKRWRIVKDSK